MAQNVQIRTVASPLVAASLDPRVIAARVKLAELLKETVGKSGHELALANCRAEGQRVLLSVLETIRQELLHSKAPN